MPHLYIAAQYTSFLVFGDIMKKTWVIGLSVLLLLSLSLITLRADPASLLPSNLDAEDQQIIASRTTAEEELLELSLQQREQQIDALEITLGSSASLPDTAIIEVNSNGQPLTKAEYILCRKTRMKIDAEILDWNDVDSSLQEKCIDILNFQEPDYVALKKAKDIEEEQQIQEYYATYNDFKDLDFEEIETNEITKETKEHDIAGYLLDDKKYVVDIVTCQESHGGCYLKINGRNTGLLEINSSYVFGENKEYTLVISSIEYNVCGKRFCDYGYDTYGLVTYKIVKRNVA